VIIEDKLDLAKGKPWYLSNKGYERALINQKNIDEKRNIFF